ncbi:MAG: iron-containing alcohol dehydrogenase [Pseudomonadota bacterium]
MAVLTYLTTTHFDFGALEMLPAALKQNGITRPLVATDKGLVAAGVVQTVLDAMGSDFDPVVYDETPGNPTEEATKDALELYTANDCDGIVALGGGSSMDLGKAVGLLAVSGGPLEQYDPLVGGAKLIKGVAPLIAVPTTSGTGSEVSVGFVIILEDGRKMTFASPLFIPKVAICDPELTMGLPAGMTAATGMDAITHCIEAFLTPAVNPPAEGIALDGLRRGVQWLPKAVADGSDRDARWHMMMCSTEGALAFVKGLGAVHAMSHAAGRIRRLNPHHGTLNAVFLPAVLRFNESVCEEKYVRLREAMGLPPGGDLAAAIEALNKEIGIPSGLADMGIEESDIAEMVEYAMKDLSARSTPRKATAEEYEAMIRESM